MFFSGESELLAKVSYLMRTRFQLDRLIVATIKTNDLLLLRERLMTFYCCVKD